MSILNSKSGLKRLFPFAKKKPNIPTKVSDKLDLKPNKQVLIDDKQYSTQNSLESIRCDILTENNEKAKPIQENTCSNELNKTTFKSEICKKNQSQNDVSEIKSKSRKSSNVSEVSIEEIKKPKENYQRWNIPFSSKFKGKDFDKTLLTMQDLIYYNPVGNPIIKEPKIEQKEDDDPDDDLLPIKLDEKQITPNNCITPCIKVGADGKIIIDQETLTLNETGLEEKREELAKSKVIEESAFHSRSYSYKRKKEHSKQWTKDETLKFYKCLMNFGTDFSMIGQYFPYRTRAQIKRKYKTEEKKNPELINGALSNSTHYDSVCIENMLQEDKLKVIEEVKVKGQSSRKRQYNNVIRSDCSRMSVCAYMMEEEIVLKNKRNLQSTISTASNLKEEVLALQSIKGKKKKCTQSKIDENKKSIIVKKKEEPVSKVRSLQDFHNEYEENITKYEDSNSE